MALERGPVTAHRPLSCMGEAIMLRVGLTGGLGSGKSTVAAILRELGAHVVEADALGRTLMEPGHAVYAQIVRAFGSEVVNPDGTLNRPRLAELAFAGGRLNELNAIVHPAVIAAQQQWMDEVFARDPAAVAVVESALIFEVERDARARGEQEGVLADWRRRFDRILLLTVPTTSKSCATSIALSPTPPGETRPSLTPAPAFPNKCPTPKRPSAPISSSTTPPAWITCAGRWRPSGSNSGPRATITPSPVH